MSDMSSFPVTHDDPGIRPAGPSNACFYCRKKVGETHGDECVMIEIDVQYDLELNGQKVGVFATTEPAHWDDHGGYFHKNEGSWCANNILDSNGLDVPPDVRARLERLTSRDSCLCFADLEFTNRVRSGEPRRGPT